MTSVTRLYSLVLLRQLQMRCRFADSLSAGHLGEAGMPRLNVAVLQGMTSDPGDCRLSRSAGPQSATRQHHLALPRRVMARINLQR